MLSVTADSVCVDENSIGLLLLIPNLRGDHPIACSGKPNLGKLKAEPPAFRCLALRTRGGR